MLLRRFFDFYSDMTAAPLSPSSEPRIAQINADDYSGGVYNEAKERAPFLVLDVREKIEYKKCHIKCAKSFPLNQLKQDKITSGKYSKRRCEQM